MQSRISNVSHIVISLLIVELIDSVKLFTRIVLLKMSKSAISLSLFKCYPI